MILNDPILSHLLPVRGIIVTLKLSADIRTAFFPQRQLRSFLDTLTGGNQLKNTPMLWIEPAESGQTVFSTGDHYRFSMFAGPGGEDKLQLVINALRGLPGTFPKNWVAGSVFQRNVQLEAIYDYFILEPTSVKNVNKLTCYDESWLEQETGFYQEATRLLLRFVSPARLKISATRKLKLGNSRPYIQDRGQLEADELIKKIGKTVANLISDPTISLPPSSGWDIQNDNLFWSENTPHNNGQHPKSACGGVLGSVVLNREADSAFSLSLLVLGQYYGVGEMRGYGLGRYRLEHPDGRGSKRPRLFSRSILQRVGTIEHLEIAWKNMCANHPSDWQHNWGGQRNWNWTEQEEKQQQVVDFLTMAKKISLGRYQAAGLRGFIHTQAGHHPRPLAVPPLADRLAQRAVLEVMTPALEQIMFDESYGYRKYRSRQMVRDRILMLIRQGYRWVYETDIDSFFDSIPFSIVENRLHSLFPDEPAIDLIMNWIQASVSFKGHTVTRTMGLPQGSPISPLFANLILSDLDSDLASLNMKLFRFADDLVVLCKRRADAEDAATRVRKSVAELGLELKPQKTHLINVNQGFTFLGYTFLNEMAVEHQMTGKDDKPDAVTMNNIPPRSWLALLLEQQPEVLSDLTPDEKKSRPSVVSSSDKIESGNNVFGRTVFVAGEYKFIKSRAGKLSITSRDKEQLHQEPLSGLQNLILLGNHHITTPCLIRVMNEDAAIHFISSSGRYIGVAAAANPNREGAWLWQDQAAAAMDEDVALKIAGQLVDARINNQIQVLRQRKRSEPEKISDAVAVLKKLLVTAAESTKLESLRGFEGLATAQYFRTISSLLPEGFEFEQRTKHPAKTPFCSLLDLGYSSLRSYAGSVLRVAGLHPWTGFYHKGRGTHQALASDMMEPYRHIVERNAMTLIKRGQLQLHHFEEKSSGACSLTSTGLRIFYPALIERFNTETASRGETDKRMLPEHLYLQALSLIHLLRNPKTELWAFKL